MNMIEKTEKIQRYCLSKWNGNGMDVFQEAIAIALERYGDLENVNFSLLKRICSEAARNLRVYERYVDMENITMPVLPDIEPEEPESFVMDMDIETKKAWIKKIQKMKEHGYSDLEIIQILRPHAMRIKKQTQILQPKTKQLNVQNSPGAFF
jgi:hypothetical protein